MLSRRTALKGALAAAALTALPDRAMAAALTALPRRALAAASPGATRAATTPVQQLLPEQGCLWGLYTPKDYNEGYQQIEAKSGRVFDIQRRYYDFSNAGTDYYSNGQFPDQGLLDMIGSGHIAAISVEARSFGQTASGQPTPAGADGWYQYSQITDGSLDKVLAQMASRLAKLTDPFLFSFQIEPEGTGAANSGTSDEFIAAWRYLHAYFSTHGVDSAVWTLNFAGLTNASDSYYQAFYPGDDVVDAIGWDPYNHEADNWQEPADLIGAGYHRLVGGMLGSGAAEKPLVLGEYGCIADDRRVAWLQALPAALAAYPQIKAATYYSSNGQWDTRLQGDDASISAFGVDSQYGYLNPRAQISYVAGASAYGKAGIELPAEVVAGTLLLLWTVGVAPGELPGWIRVTSVTAGNCPTALFYRVAAAGDAGTTVPVVQDDPSDVTLLLAGYGGATVHAWAYQTASYTTPTVKTTIASCGVVSAICDQDGRGRPADYPVPSTLTQRVLAGGTTVAGTEGVVADNGPTGEPIGSCGGATFGTGASESVSAWTVALAPTRKP
jgi:hypothetical protein